MSLLVLLQGGSAPAEITSTASWAQTAAWSGSAAETIGATAAFAQSASWSAAAAETVTGSAVWEQSASWSAAAGESISATATFAQAAGWVAEGSLEVVAEMTFVRAPEAWGASAVVEVTEPALSSHRVGAFISARAQPHLPEIRSAASFGQSAGRWLAVLDTNDDDLVLELLEMAA